MKIAKLAEKIEIPAGVSLTIEGRTIKVKGPKGELSRTFNFPRIQFVMEGNKLVIFCIDAKKNDKTMLGTAYSHMKNMLKGVVEPHVYKLKICTSHFPMTVAVTGDTVVVKNFLGEKIPRTVKIKQGAKVKIEGAEITVEAVDIEVAGQTAADIELLTRIVKRDIRIFQDGIYITQKPA